MEVKIGPLNFNKLKQNDLDFFIFLAKLGLSLRKKIISFEEFDLFFNRFFLNKSKIENAIYNLCLIMEEINGSLLENIEFLFKTCSKKYSIDYSEIIKKLYGTLCAR